MKIAVIGCGRQAAKHVAGLRKCPDIELVVVDKEPALAQGLAEREGLAWAMTVDQVIADPAVAAVAICVPTPVHAPLMRQALAAGKDFFCEKPLCETVAEARELVALTEQAKRIGIVGYVYRHAPVFQQVKSILAGARDNGTCPVLGTISVAMMRIGGRGSAALWKHRRDEGGGAINEMLVHMIDLAVWYFGPIERAELLMEDLFRPQRTIAGRIETVDAEDFVLARFRTAAGVPVVIQADSLTPSFTQLIEIEGDNGTLMASIQPEMPQFVFAIRPAGGYPAGRTALDCAQANLFDAQMASFVAAVRERRSAADSTLADSIHVMRAIEALRGQRKGPG